MRITAAAGIWSLAYGGLALFWALGGSGFPFGEGDIPDARAESALGAATAAGTAPVIAALGFGSALLALAMIVLRRPRVPVIIAAWGLAFTLVAVIPDARVLTAIGYAPIFLVGLPWGWPEGNYFELGFPWPVINMVICLLGGLLWAGAALSFQRRTAGACERCGREPGRLAAWTSPARAARWGRWAVGVAVAVPLFYAAVRWAWALKIPLLMSEAGIDDLHASGLVWGGAGLATFAAVGGVLTLGLVQRWGEVWPRWVIGLAGRRVPLAFPVTFAGAVTVVLSSAGMTAVRITDWTDPMAWLVSPMAYWPLWAVALGVATVAYYLRRRGRCNACARL